MEEILHFPGIRRLSSKNRNMTMQPSVSDNENEGDNNSSPLIKKKSHFSDKKTPNSNFEMNECDLGDDDTHSPLSN